MRYWQAMTERKLRRQRVILYVSRPLENTPRLFTGNAALLSHQPRASTSSRCHELCGNGTFSRKSPASSTFLRTGNCPGILAQLRKFNCWNISIVQQYARFKQSRIRSAVFGNSRQFYLMRQNDRADSMTWGRHRTTRSDAARDHELSVARPSIGTEVFAVHLFSHRLRQKSLRHRFTTFRPARCSIAVRPAASISTNAPVNCARVPTSVSAGGAVLRRTSTTICR